MLVSAESDKIVDQVTSLFLIALQYRVATTLHDGLCTKLEHNYTSLFSRAESPSIFILIGIMQLYINLNFNIFIICLTVQAICYFIL